MIQFHGQTDMYPTPNDGDCEIGVTHGLGQEYIVAWQRPTGAYKRVTTSSLPVSATAVELQTKLDAWAAVRGLRRVTPGGPISGPADPAGALGTCRDCHHWSAIATTQAVPDGLCRDRRIARYPTDPQCETFEHRKPGANPS